MHVTAIVLAAGKGLRLESKVPKPLIEINSQALIIYCLKTLDKHPRIKDIILVVNSKNLKYIGKKIKQYRIRKIRNLVLGGKRRTDSVFCGLRAISPHTDLVLIHDAARPFIAKKFVSSVIKEAARCGAAVLGVPVKATIKEVRSPQLRTHGKFVKRTLNRNNFWEVQTPQVFKRDLILQAYDKFKDREVTDDASLVEKLGHKVSLVRSSYSNIKITTPEDLILAEAIGASI